MISLSQSWDQPVNIYSGGYNTSPDFCIDSCGIIHCVWEHKIGVNYRKIYYSRSLDMGSTWSDAKDISLNTNLWVSDPHIVSDTTKNLFVSYDFNTGSPNSMLVLIKKFDGIQWGNPDTISTDMPGSMNNRLVIDYDNKLYCFWSNGIEGGKIFYRYMINNNGWSEIFKPFSGNDDHYFLSKAVVDIQNNLHCSGAHHYAGQSSYDDRAIYFNYINGAWSDFIELSNNTTWDGLDIALDSKSFPSITWGQRTSTLIPPNHGTFVASYDGSNWPPPLMLVEDHPEEQAIAIDIFNNIYIVDNEKNDTGYQQVCYKKANVNWVKEVVDQNNFGYYCHKLIVKNNELYMLFIKVDTLIQSSSFTSIQLRKCKIPTNINKKNRYYSFLNISPNPFGDKIQIQFKTYSFEYINIRIYNQNSQLINTLFDGYKTPGSYCIYWDGTDHSGKEVSSGLYLLQFKIGSIVDTREIIQTQ